jgi:hypothetical protein
MAGFDCKCPYCDREIEDLHRKWSDRDYSTNFELQCNWCSRNVAIGVGMEPIFETSKPTCCMCSRAETGSNGHYCDPCYKKLIEASKG